VDNSIDDDIQRLAALLEQARPMPLMRNRVRVDRKDAEALIDAIQQAHAGNRGEAVTAATTKIRVALGDSFPVPLTDQVRIDRAQALALAQALRSAAGLSI
jgi:hypothetical protein